MDGNAISDLADEVERYLAAHPDAADSAEGIRRWWLPAGRLDVRTDQLQSALALLVARGRIVERRMPDGRRIYASSDESRNNS